MLSTFRNFLRSLDRSPLAWLIAIAGALIFALMLPAAMGLTYGDHTLREFWDWKNILFVILTLFTLSQWKISRWFVAIPLVLIFGCYLPAGILYGKPSILVAIALMQTTPTETREFLMNTPWQLFAEAIGFIFAGLAAVHFFGQVKIPRKTGFVTGLAACAIAWFMSYGSGKTYEQIQTASFFHSFGTTMWYSAEELREEANALPPSWQVTSAEPQYKTYVVIIGESQRRDYASVYGYPLDTTPYLNRADGTFFSNFIAPGGNTGISLPRLLSYNTPGTDRYSKENNIVTLANTAGFDTWWISNQGRGGAFDNPIAQIGVRSHHTIWLKGNYADANVDDDMLLPKIRAALKQESGSNKPRVLFVHLMGSHPTFCTRLSGRPAAFDVGDSAMDCYLTTYRMMDSFVERTVDLLKTNAGGSWSLVYFADHGLSMEKKPGTDSGKELEHGYDHRQNYEVPFFRISSDSHGHQVNPAYRTGFRMLEGLADWMGIRVSNENIRHSPEFWSEGSDTKIRVFGDRQYNELPEDPAIRFRSK